MKKSATAASAASPAVSLLPPFRIKIVRSFRAVDDGTHRKWIVIAYARDLPPSLPLDANARIPNVLKNKHCKEMRRTLVEAPELWPVLNSGMICTAEQVKMHQEGDSQFVEVVFEDGTQGVVNGGHTYAQLIHFVHGDTRYSGGMALRDVLLKDARELEKGDKDDHGLADLATNDDALQSVVSSARDKAMVQIEFVAPVADSGLLTRIARARNLSQTVEDTAFQNLAGRFEVMKDVLANAPSPFGPDFANRVIWKTNEEAPEGSTAIAVKNLVQILALSNKMLYPPDTKPAAEVYMRSGIVVREFGETEGPQRDYFEKLMRILPRLLVLHDHIYAGLQEVDPLFPWDGKVATPEKPKKKTVGVLTPFVQKTVGQKVASAFLWPVFAAFRGIITEKPSGELDFVVNPIELFDSLKNEIVTRVENLFHQSQLVQQVGRTSDLWVRLDSIVENEIKTLKRLGKL